MAPSGPHVASSLPPFLLFKLVFSLLRRTCLIEDVAGKVVVITGASSGIGEHVAYEYAKRGACLVLVARREDRLRIVADKAKQLGSPDVLVVKADVSNAADCKNFVDQTILHFHKLDHLVNNAGIAPVCMFEDYEDVSDYKSVMDVNFWGSVYSTQFAIPHLKQSRGKIIVISSNAGWYSCPRLSIYGATKAALISFFETLRVEVGSEIGITIITPGLVDSEITDTEFMSKETNFWGTVYTTRFAVPHLRNSRGRVVVISSGASWFPMPRCSFYNASKAAVAQFFDTLRIEFGSDVKVTIVTPGFIESEMIQGKFLFKGGKMEFDPDMRDAQAGLVPVRSVVACAKTIVKSARRGDRYLVEPAWFRVSHWLKTFCPEILDVIVWLQYITKPGASPHESFNKKIMDLLPGARALYGGAAEPPANLKAD